MRSASALPQRLAWAALAVPLVILLLAAATDQRRGWPDLLAGEPTVLMQAESLVHDGDLQYSRLDFDRHFLSRPALPVDLSLASGSAGREITFDHPILHTLTLAPWLAWRPAGGHALGHALLLALAAAWVSWRLLPRIGFVAPLAVSWLLFTSAAFAHTFLATAGAWAFVAGLIAAGLLVEPPAGEVDPDPRGGERRWLAAGVVLSLAVMVDAVNLVLVVGAWLVAPEIGRMSRRLSLGLGLFGGLVFQGLLLWWAGGGLGVFGTERFRFRAETGFPLVDFPSTEWTETMRMLTAVHFDGAPRLSWGLDAALWAWNAVDLMVGQHAGLLVYGLPAIVVCWAGSRRGRRAWLITGGLFTLAVLFRHPFDLAAGPTVANARGLPLIAFSAIALAVGETRLDRHSRPRTVTLLTFGLVVVGALGLGGLWPWLSPNAARYPIAPGEGLAYPTAFARSWLPYETAQQTLPGGPVLEHGALRVRPLSRHVEAAPGDALTMAGDQTAHLWVSSLEPVDGLRLEFGEDAPSTIELKGGRLGERVLTADGGITFQLEPVVDRRLVLWWSPRRQSVYRLSFHFPGGPDARLRFRIVGETVSDEADS